MHHTPLPLLRCPVFDKKLQTPHLRLYTCKAVLNKSCNADGMSQGSRTCCCPQTNTVIVGCTTPPVITLLKHPFLQEALGTQEYKTHQKQGDPRNTTSPYNTNHSVRYNSTSTCLTNSSKILLTNSNSNSNITSASCVQQDNRPR